ncbi:UNVERIFIED_CONTAM: hypothetical protein K2H54_041817 [Gekko kuhli]
MELTYIYSGETNKEGFCLNGSHEVGFRRRQAGAGDHPTSAFGKNLNNVVKKKKKKSWTSGCFFVWRKKRNQDEGDASGSVGQRVSASGTRTVGETSVLLAFWLQDNFC